MAFTYKNYTESNAVKKLREQASQYQTYKEAQSVVDSYNALKQKEANKIADWSGGTYGQALKDQMDKINNRKQFTYDLNGDALYQQYKDQYMTQGRLASADAIGQASAMTGGYGNSYAATVGNQAYQGYLQKLNDVVPELYNMAYNRYQQEGQDMKDMYAMYESAYGREYGEHRDKVGDYNTELARLQDIYYNEKNFDYNKFATDRDFYNTAYNNERTYDYGQYTDAYNRAFGQYQQGVSEDQWLKNYNLQSRQVAASEASAAAAKKQADAAAKAKQYAITNYSDIPKNIRTELDTKIKQGSLFDDPISGILDKFVPSRAQSKKEKTAQDISTYLTGLVKTGQMSPAVSDALMAEYASKLGL